MADLFDVSIGKWWRFTSYEVVDGFIRRTRKANLKEYYPWREYSRSLRNPPYISLARLADSLDPPSGVAVNDSKEDEQQIVEWCGKYGLLGLLPTTTLIAVLRARWEPEKIASPTRFRLVPTTHTLMRLNTGWLSEWDAVIDGPEEFRLSQKDRIVPEEYVPTVLQKPGVLEQSFGGRRFQWRSFTDSWAWFFPDVPADEKDSFRYPTPLSDKFWHHYAEPVQMFRTAAVMFRDMVDVLASVKEEPVPLSNLNSLAIERISESSHILQSFLTPVGPTLTIDPSSGRLGQTWSCGSLLASLSMMLFRHLTEGPTRILRCDRARCRKFFVGSEHNRRFCSDRCRWAVYQQMQRAKPTSPASTSLRERKARRFKKNKRK
jgi:hypothetical protein